ncbi:hypothetical protein PIB30_068045, partial [Stylosanthes scabra]|nr:hypothetical protein [Stylosanthes scabra]
MTRGDRGRGKGDRGRGTGGRRGRPRKRTGIPLDLRDTEAGTSTPPITSTSVIPTSSLSEGFPAMMMIPTPGLRVQSSETAGTRGGEEEDIAMEEELARQAGRIYLRWDGGNWWFVPQFSLAPDHAAFFRLQRGYEFAIYQSWRMRAAKRLREMMHEIRNKGAPHGWIRDDLWHRLVEFWRQEDYKKLKQTNKKNRASETGGSLYTGGSTTYKATRERMAWSWGDHRNRVRSLRGPTPGRRISCGSTGD